jgi:hypothetical protein
MGGTKVVANALFFLLGMRPCSAAATSAVGVSVSPEEGPRSAGRGPAVGVGDKGLGLPVGCGIRMGMERERRRIGRHDLAFRVLQSRSQSGSGKRKITRTEGGWAPYETRCSRRMGEMTTLVARVRIKSCTSI